MFQPIKSHRVADEPTPEPPKPPIPWHRTGPARRLGQLASIVAGIATIFVSTALIGPWLFAFTAIVTLLAFLVAGIAKCPPAPPSVASVPWVKVFTIAAWWPITMPAIAIRRLMKWIFTGE